MGITIGQPFKLMTAICHVFPRVASDDLYQLIQLGKRPRVMMNGLSADLNRALGQLYGTDLIGSFTSQSHCWCT